jgi:hypothetical protein
MFDMLVADAVFHSPIGGLHVPVINHEKSVTHETSHEEMIP